MRRIAVLDAPSNLGLRPPTATSVPGCAKAPGALRDHGLLTRLHARDAGCLTPPRYDAGEWRPGDGVAHAQQIANYSRALADRIGAILDAGEFPVILGGDCSILLGSGVAMNRLGEAVGGRIGLVFVDGHSDFRHPGNASYVGAAAGEDLALVTGRGQPDLAAIEGRRPYFRDVDVVVMGIRAQDEYRLDLQAAGIVTRPVPALRAEGAARSAQWARDQLVDCAGYWVHVDVDVLDPAVMPAVDAPSPGGIAFPELELLLAGLVESPHCLGVEITVFDPDYDPDGSYAEEITSAVASGLAAARTVNARPDLVAAREDLRGGTRRVPDQVAQRRAAAAAESVTLAAEGISAGAPGTSQQTGAPATTLLAVDHDLTDEPTGDAPEAGYLTDKDEPSGDAPDVGYLADADEPSGDAPDVGYLADADEPSGDAPDVGYLADADEPSGDAPDVGYSADTDEPSGDAPDVRHLADEDEPFGDAPDVGFFADADEPAGDAPDVGYSADAGGSAGGAPGAGYSAGAGEPAGGAPDGGHPADKDEPFGDAPDFEHPAEPAGDAPVAGYPADADEPFGDAPDLDPPAGAGKPVDAAESFSARYASLVEAGWDAQGGPIHADGPAADEDDEPVEAQPVADEPVEAQPVVDETTSAEVSHAGHPDGADGEVTGSEDREDPVERRVRLGLVPRPLGSAPLLDSEPLPATRPGMLRPRPTDDHFSLPVQRPAFDAGSDRPADIT